MSLNKHMYSTFDKPEKMKVLIRVGFFTLKMRNQSFCLVTIGCLFLCKRFACLV